MAAYLDPASRRGSNLQGGYGIDPLAVVLKLFIAELILGGPGVWLSVGPVSLRKILFAIACFIAGVRLITSRCLRLHDCIFPICLALFLALWGVFIPLSNDVEISSIIQDDSSWLVLILYFLLAPLVRNESVDYRGLRSWAFICVLILATTFIVLWLFVALHLLDANIVREGVIGLLDPGASENDDALIYVGYMPDGFFRVMWISALFIMPVFFTNLSRALQPIWKLIIACLLIFAVYVSYTRALWFGISAGVAVYLTVTILGTKDFAWIWKVALVALLVSLVIMFVASDSTYSERFLTVALDISAIQRFSQISPLLDAWQQAPIFGLGLGAHASEIRSQTAPFSYELTYLALLMKIGIVGIILTVGLLIIFILSSARSAIRSRRITWLSVWLASVISFLVVTATNPYLFNFVGMSITVYLLLEYVYEKQKIQME